MWPAITVVAVLVLALTVGGDFDSSQQQTVANGEATALATNLVVYGTYAMQYARLNPTAQGSVSDALMGVPYWLVHTPYVGIYVANGRGYAYYSGPAIPALPGQVAAQTQMAMNTGIVTGGVLVEPQIGATPSIPIPAVIPNGSVVVTN